MKTWEIIWAGFFVLIVLVFSVVVLAFTVSMISDFSNSAFCENVGYDSVREVVHTDNGELIKCCRKIINENRTGFDEICEVFEV